MKFSRWWEAALASIALVASGTVQAQAPHYSAAGYGTAYPAPPAYSAPYRGYAPPSVTPAPQAVRNQPHNWAATQMPAAAYPLNGPVLSPPATPNFAPQVYGSSQLVHLPPTAPVPPQSTWLPQSAPATSATRLLGEPPVSPVTTPVSISTVSPAPGSSVSPSDMVPNAAAGGGNSAPGTAPGCSTWVGSGVYSGHDYVGPQWPVAAGGKGGVSGWGPSGDCNAGSCAPSCEPSGCPCWYAGAYGLLLTRDRQDNFTFSWDTFNEARQLTNAKDADFSYEGGFAVSVGRMFNCCQNAVEVVYWGWFPGDTTVATYGVNVSGNLNGIHNWDSLDYNGATADTWVDNAAIHSLFRESEVHNVELNLLRLNGSADVCTFTPFQYSLLAGVRYFRFDDHLIFASDTVDAVIDRDASEIYYDIQTVNNLIGFQVGGVGTYNVSPRMAFNMGTKFGLFGNHITHRSSIGGPSGIAVINNGPHTGRQWLVDNDKNDVSFLGEVFVGGSYSVGRCWSFSAGYRAVAITGLALPTDQIYPDLRGINDVESIESNGSTILHGAYLGGQFCY